ncbi:hypothetical protein MTO96_004524 [Rhipicephalus appendiculatus]
MPLCSGLKKKPSLTMEARVELYGKGRIKLSFDGVSEEAHNAQPPLHQDESVTEPGAPRRPFDGHYTPQAQLGRACTAADARSDDDHPEPSNPV